jgi:hypothetical protein
MRDLRLSMRRFIERAQPAVADVSTELQRLRMWLEGEQMRHWQIELRRREAKLNEAEGQLRGARMSSLRGDCLSEKRKVAVARERVEEAAGKLRAIKRWLRNLDIEAREPLARIRLLGTALETDLPHAEFQLKQMIEHLEAYAEVSKPKRKGPERGDDA